MTEKIGDRQPRLPCGDCFSRHLANDASVSPRLFPEVLGQ
jgi:hypothetical protein